MNKDITIVLISHKSKDLVINYIKNIYTKLEIIIIDNSNDYELTKNINQDYPGVHKPPTPVINILLIFGS